MKPQLRCYEAFRKRNMKRSARLLFRVAKPRFIGRSPASWSCFATRFMRRQARFIEKSTCFRKCFFLVGAGGFVTTEVVMKSCFARWNPSRARMKSSAYGLRWNEIRLHLPAKRDFIAKRFHPPKVDFFRRRRISLKKALALASAFFWWERVDSDHRSQWQQIYSLPPLAARERSLILLLSALLRQRMILYHKGLRLSRVFCKNSSNFFRTNTTFILYHKKIPLSRKSSASRTISPM